MACIYWLNLDPSLFPIHIPYYDSGGEAFWGGPLREGGRFEQINNLYGLTLETLFWNDLQNAWNINFCFNFLYTTTFICWGRAASAPSKSISPAYYTAWYIQNKKVENIIVVIGGHRKGALSESGQFQSWVKRTILMENKISREIVMCSLFLIDSLHWESFLSYKNVGSERVWYRINSTVN